MAVLNIENTEISVCERCPIRFVCFTNRWNYDGLCNIDNFLKLTAEERKQIHIAKAKRQGHYFTEGDANGEGDTDRS